MFAIGPAAPGLPRRAAATDTLVLLSGYFAAVEGVQGVGNKVSVDGRRQSRLKPGAFTMTQHAEIDPVTGEQTGSSTFTFASGDGFNTTDTGLGESTGVSDSVGDIGLETVLLKFASGTGRFAHGAGDLTLERMVHVGVNGGDSFAWFKGEFLK